MSKADKPEKDRNTNEENLDADTDATSINSAISECVNTSGPYCTCGREREVLHRAETNPEGYLGRWDRSVGRRQCRFRLNHLSLGDEISQHLADSLRWTLILEIRRILMAMREAQHDATRSPKRPRHVVATWRCEEVQGGSWSARVCRDLLGIGKSQSCKQHLCSKMKERLNRHQMNCQAVTKAPTVKPQRAKTINKMDRASSTSTKSSLRKATSRANSPLAKNSEIQTVHTNLSYADKNRPERDNQTSEVDKEENRLLDGIKIKASETREIIPKRNVYSERLNSEIQEFFYDIPVFPNTSEFVKQKRLEIIRNFVDKIADLFVHINDDNYYDKVRDEIEQCLRDLPMWEPESEREKKIFKNCLGGSLCKFIQTFNEQWYSYRKDSHATKKIPNSFVAYNDHMNHILENVIVHWVDCNLKTNGNTDIVINSLLKKIQPLLESGTNTKHVLKSELLKIFEELSPHLHLSKPKSIQLNKLTSDLATVLSTMEENKNGVYDLYHLKKRHGVEEEETSIEILNDLKIPNDFEDDTVNQITDILFGNIDLVLHDNNQEVVRDVRCVLKSTGEFTELEAANLAKTLVMNVKDCFNKDFYSKMENPSHSSSFLILTSEHELSKSSSPKFDSTTSTSRKKEIPILNKEEKLYTEKVSAIVRTWLDTTDVNFDTMEGQIFKETVVTDIVNDVRDNVKRTIQLQIPGLKIDGKHLKCVIMRAIRRYELFSTPITEESPQVVDLWEHIMALDTRSLNTSSFSEPQHRNSQAMAHAKCGIINEIKKRRELIYQPKSSHLLEDNISVWMNEQPSDIFEVSDTAARNQLLQEIATNVQGKMVGEIDEDAIKNEITQWLNKIVKPQMKRNIDALAENLKDRIIKLSQDQTLSRADQTKMNKWKGSPVKCNDPKHDSNINSEAEVKLNEFVKKIILHKYNIDDDVVKGVLTLILKQELYKMSPPIREDLYKNITNDEFNTDKFQMELEIVMVVYDWLKKISFYFPLLKPGPETIDFVHSLARNITDIETERINNPNRMDYDSWLHTEIAVYLLQKEKEIEDENLPKIDYHANELCLRIMNLRKDCNEGELNKIIAMHMKKYDCLLAKDYLKKILWHRRLGENVMKLLLENPAASRENVENTLTSVPVPRDESVVKFKMEIKYNITIQDWLHALPIIPPKDNEEELRRKNMIPELLQKIMETDARKGENPHDNQADEDLDDYIADWISRLNLDPTVNIEVPMVVSQLISGLEFIKWTENQPQQTSDLNLQGKNNRTRLSKEHETKLKDPGEQIVEAIESWCNNLPIEGDTLETTKAIKEQVATNMFQIVGSLSSDPRIGNDKQKFREKMANEIEAQLQNLSEHCAVTEKKDFLKTELLERIIEIKDMIRYTNAGSDYVQVLENSIDKSLSKPTHGFPTKINPGYEIFKKRMVMLWLLQNYDYAVDFHSLKYKKMLSDEIHLLSEEGQKGDEFPVDQEEIINDLMSVFYRAYPPNEDAIIYEIEYIKLRCEIESWVKELPLRESFGYRKLLERDQILTILAKILFDIEKSEEADLDEKMHTEIMKWSKKLPLLPGEKNNLTAYADLLVCLLKTSANSRKCLREPELNNLNVVQETLKNLKSGDELNKIRDTLNVPKTKQANANQVAGPSAPRPCSRDCGATKEKLVYLITKAINNWCNHLPLQVNSPDEQDIVQRTKEQIIQRLMHFVSELHYRSNTLNNDGMYEYYLNNEIENILIQLTTEGLYWEAQLDRNYRKYQLINALKAIRPLVQEEKEKEGYKDKLKHTISSFYESMVPHAAVQITTDTQMAILDDFLQFKNHKGDFETQELYRLKINETLNNEFNDQEINIDPLLATNQLICALTKETFPTESNRKIAQSDRVQRRFSHPNPVGGINRLPAVPAVRRNSLPYTLSHNSRLLFVPSQNFLQQHSEVMTCPNPVSLLQPYPVLRSMPVPACQLPPYLQPGSKPFPAPRSIPQRSNDIQVSVPFPASRAAPQSPSDFHQGSMPFFIPRITSQRSANLQQDPIVLPYPLHQTKVPQAHEIRPFPIPHPTYNKQGTNSNYLYQRAPNFIQGPETPEAQFVEQHNVQSDFDMPAQSYREIGPQNVAHQNLYLNVPTETGETETRTTARIQNSPGPLAECPEEQRRYNRKEDERWTDRERRRVRRADGRDYCKTCDRDRDCGYNVPRPYPMPMDYMY